MAPRKSGLAGLAVRAVAIAHASLAAMAHSVGTALRSNAAGKITSIGHRARVAFARLWVAGAWAVVVRVGVGCSGGRREERGRECAFPAVVTGVAGGEEQITIVDANVTHFVLGRIGAFAFSVEIDIRTAHARGVLIVPADNGIAIPFDVGHIEERIVVQAGSVAFNQGRVIGDAFAANIYSDRAACHTDTRILGSLLIRMAAGARCERDVQRV